MTQVILRQSGYTKQWAGKDTEKGSIVVKGQQTEGDTYYSVDSRKLFILYDNIWYDIPDGVSP